MAHRLVNISVRHEGQRGCQHGWSLHSVHCQLPEIQKYSFKVDAFKKVEFYIKKNIVLIRHSFREEGACTFDHVKKKVVSVSFFLLILYTYL